MSTIVNKPAFFAAFATPLSPILVAAFLIKLNIVSAISLNLLSPNLLITCLLVSILPRASLTLLRSFDIDFTRIQVARNKGLTYDEMKEYLKQN